jgi:nicotinamidase-related amidase
LALLIGVHVENLDGDRQRGSYAQADTTMARALLIVDFQNDFTPGGALAVSDGDEIAGRVNELAGSGAFDLVVATRDWHPPDHGSFTDHGGPWPPHCVAGSDGAQLHPALDRTLIDAVIDKGTDPEADGYSGFEATGLAELLRRHEIDEVVVCGLATDYCVKMTALDALRAGLKVHVDRRGVRGVDLEPGDSERALDELRTAGATLEG